MSLLAIPEPATVDLDRARDLATAVMAWAEECDSIDELEDARAKVAAIETYLRRRGEAVAAEIAAADRRLEVRIGALLGPRSQGERSDLSGTSPHEGKLPSQRASEFRRMAEHADDPDVNGAIDNGASRRQVLDLIDQARADRQAIRDLNNLAPEGHDPDADKARAHRTETVFMAAEELVALGDPSNVVADLRDFHAPYRADVAAAADWLNRFLDAWETP